MPDVTDSDSSNDPPSTPENREWYIQQWDTLCDELGASTPNEVLSRVQTLRRRVDLDDPDHEDEGLVTISEVEEVFRDLNSKIAQLRRRNASLVERLESEADGEDPLTERHEKTEELLDAIGVNTIDAAQSHVSQLEGQLEELYREKEQLTQAGLSSTEEALEALEQARDERDALKQERDQLKEELAATTDTSDDADSELLKAASIISEEIGISSPKQAVAFKKAVKDVHDRIQRRAHAHDLAPDSTPDDVVGMLRNMSKNLNTFPAPDVLPSDAAAVLGVEDVSGLDDVVDTAHHVAEGLSALGDSAAENLPDPEGDDVLSLLESIADHLDHRLAADDMSSSATSLPAEAADVLGIHTVEDAHELNALIENMSEELEQFRSEHEKLADADLSVEGALTMIDNMEAQLADLYHHGDLDANGRSTNDAPAALQSLDAPLAHRIKTLIDLPEDSDDLPSVVQQLVQRLESLADEHEVLEKAGLTVEEAITLINNMEAQLSELYEQEEQEALSDAAARLDDIEDVLGISTREEAEELSAIAERMEAQLTSLYEEKRELQDLGLGSIEDAVDMVKSMETQLDELYEDKEALRNAELRDTEDQSTFQQLEALYAERQKLQESLGVASADDVIELVESLNTQLDDLYTGRDADVDPEERYEAQLWSPESPEPESPPPDADAEAPDPAGPDPSGGSADSLTMSSMEHQLEALYREKETLLHHGFGSADEAVARLQTQKRQINVLQRENHTYEQRFARLQSELGTERVPRIVDLVRTLETEAGSSIDELQPSSDASDTSEYGLNIEATSPFVEPDTLARLDDMTAEELNALEVGVMRLSDDGTVEALNTAALQLPSLHSVTDRDSAIGRNFFLDLAPSTNNNLFFGRFQKGQTRGEIDACFPYTFTSPVQESESFSVHLYRAPDSENTWLLFRPA